MFEITDKAAELIKDILADSEIKEGMCFRLIPKEEPGRYGFDFVDIRSTEDEDHIFKSEGHPILIVGKAENEQLTGMRLDVVENEEGRLSLAITET